MQLNEIKGIGPKTISILNKNNIYEVSDFVTYYPYRYELITRSNLDLALDGDKVIVDGIIETIPTVAFFGRKKNSMRFLLNTKSKQVQIVIYNRAYLKRNLLPGKSVVIIGKYDKKHQKIVASELRFGNIKKDTIERVYHLVEGLSRKQFSEYVDIALTFPFEVTDYVPDVLNEKYNLLDKYTAIKEIHHPTNPKLLNEARKKLIYEELFCYMLKVGYLKKNRKQSDGIKKDAHKKEVDEFINSLPFKLTKDQLTSIESIMDDMKSEYQMNRLLQGDVGSGKTIVAVVCMYINYLNGYQSALMAPTEILAEQHFKSFTKLFHNYGINIALLTGSMKTRERKKVLKDILDGKTDMIIGTHALISDDVIYNNLGLVITDEQHRFGVHQRTNLMNKGLKPDMLSMSATPIPRTYALTVYGDMDISNIETMPSGRKKIKTTIKSEKEITDVLNSMYDELKKKHQIYVIAPLIEDLEDTNKNDVNTVYENMQKAFGKKYNLGYLHGKMKQQEKDTVMNNFKKGDIDILVSTTVIEVGVDVQNATMIVIFNAEQFGLATLHQLRGRVGRNDLDSYCILISNQEKERLQILVNSNNGFVISEEDFKMRGSGDLFGLKQSGDMIFKIADLKRDFKTLTMAKKDSDWFLDNFNLEDYKDIYELLSEDKKYVS